jgi:hypothetical protein
MIDCSNEIKSYDEIIEIVAQKYFNDFIMGEGDYRWDIGKEMKKSGLSKNDDNAECRIMQRLDELTKNKDGSQVV